MSPPTVNKALLECSACLGNASGTLGEYPHEPDGSERKYCFKGKGASELKLEVESKFQDTEQSSMAQLYLPIRKFFFSRKPTNAEV